MKTLTPHPDQRARFSDCTSSHLVCLMSLVLASGCAGDAKDLGSSSERLDQTANADEPNTPTNETDEPNTPQPGGAIDSSGAFPTPTTGQPQGSNANNTPTNDANNTPTNDANNTPTNDGSGSEAFPGPTPVSATPVPTTNSPVSPAPASRFARTLPSLEECEAELNEQGSFDDAATPAGDPGLEHLYGDWVDTEVMVGDLGLPSGSKRLQLTLSENGGTLVLGEEPGPMPDVDTTIITDTAQEGFAYNVFVVEVRENEYYAPLDATFDTVAELEVAPYQIYDASCSQREPEPGQGVQCGYTCLPTEISDWLTATEEGETCHIDETHSIDCSELALCSFACFCDEDACHYDPFTRLRLTLRWSEGDFLNLSLPEVWTYANNTPTLGPNGEVWAQLE